MRSLETLSTLPGLTGQGTPGITGNRTHRAQCLAEAWRRSSKNLKGPVLEELAKERQESAQLLKAHQDKDELIGKLKEEIDLLNRDLDDIEDENEQLKHENKTLLKVVGQLTR
ncbi:UNVERIFIED_CONTAM: hypothetical protein FKN15_069994 [Acipenser sinensis]